MLNIHLLKELLLKTLRKGLNMHIVAISTTFAASIHILFTFGVHKIRDWRKLSLNFFTIPKSTIDMLLGIF